jgi:hypothetical protein
MDVDESGRGWIVVVTDRGRRHLAAHGRGESTQIFARKAAALDLQEAMRLMGHRAAVVRADWSVSSGEPADR